VRGLADERLRQLQILWVPEQLQPDVDSLLAAREITLQPEFVVSTLERAVQGYESAHRVDKEAAALVRLGAAYEETGQDERAREAYEKADILLDQLRGLLVVDSTRIGLRANFEDLYVHLVLLHARRNAPEDRERVWYWVERAKSRTLVELMGLGTKRRTGRIRRGGGAAAAPGNPAARASAARPPGARRRVARSRDRPGHPPQAARCTRRPRRASVLVE
jgi:hypothetical protein